jgi:hypothetical protein
VVTLLLLHLLLLRLLLLLLLLLRQAQSKREDDERKRQEAAARKAELKRLQEQEEAALTKPKPNPKANRVSGPKVMCIAVRMQLILYLYWHSMLYWAGAAGNDVVARNRQAAELLAQHTAVAGS